MVVLGLNYKDAGVDVEAGYESVRLIQSHVKSTMRPEVLSDIGGFGGLFSLAGAKAMEQALEDYRNMYGQIFLELLLDWKGYDFESVDDYLGIDEPERICQDMKRPEAD